MTATADPVALAPHGGGPDVPDGDDVHECSVEGCEAWRYSRLALEFHQLREHGLAAAVGGTA